MRTFSLVVRHAVYLMQTCGREFMRTSACFAGCKSPCILSYRNIRFLGVETDLTARGMGVRSQRYSMLVEDGVVKQFNLEAPGNSK